MNWSPDARQGLSKVSQGPLSIQPDDQQTREGQGLVRGDIYRIMDRQTDRGTIEGVAGATPSSKQG